MDTVHAKTTKESLIADIKRRQEDKIIEESNAKLLIKLIENAEDLNEAINIAALGTTYKRTGFHFDKRLEKLGSDIKYFKKNEKLSFVGANENTVRASSASPLTHKLIIGDNYDALQNLLIEYKGKIDVIYIDPPYGKDSMGEFAETNYDNAITRDNLLSMLYNRLVLARELMSDDGVIFCSIDDRNQAYVKCLFDEVFGESNYVATLNWKKKKQPSYLSAVAGVMEYILVYATNRRLISKLSVDEISDSNKPVINASNNVCERIIRKGIRVKTNVNLIKKGLYQNKTMTIEYLDDVNIKNGVTLNEFRCKAKFRTKQEDIDNFCSQNLIFITKNLGLRRDIANEEKGKAKAITDLLLDWGQNQDGSDELKSIFNINDDSNIFDNPKPPLLIKNIIKSTMKQDAIVCDFFAGSGTTGQAVLELNKEDGGNRQFILCTNNDETDTTPKGIALDVTSKRLKRVMTGECYDGTKDFDWIKKNEALGGSLDVYDITSVFNYENTKGKTAFDVIDETLYGMPKFENVNDKIKWVCENFEHTQKLEN